MNRILVGGSLIAGFVLLAGVPSAAQPLVQCLSPDAENIIVPEGFDCVVFADSFDGLDRPTGLAVDDDGNVLVTRSGSSVGPDLILRFSPDGSLNGTSDPIVDPDGIAIDSTGQIFAAGGSQVTIVNSLDGGLDEICRSPFSNLQDVAVDSRGRIVVIDFAGNVWEVECNTSTALCVSLGGIGTGVAFDEGDRLFATTFGSGAGLFRVDQCGSAATRIATLSGARRTAFGPGGPFGGHIFVTDENWPNESRIVKIDEASGDITDFASGFTVPNGLAFSGPENLYVADIDEDRIVRIFPEIRPMANFQCYEADGEDVDIVVSLTDQFEALRTRIDEPGHFCNPVDRDGEGIADPTAHLTCYEFDSGDDDDDDIALRRELVVNNPFGEQTLTTGATRSLCVPSIKNDEPSDLILDHFKCYEAEGASLNVSVDLEDQFAATQAVIVESPKQFCNPVDKNGEGIIDASAQLTCYRLRIARPDDDDDDEDGERNREVIVANQFGEHVLEVGDSKQLCVQSELLGFEIAQTETDNDD